MRISRHTGKSAFTDSTGMVSASSAPTAATHASLSPSAWVCRFAPLVSKSGAVLDLAAGGGRHTGLFLEQGYKVVAVDRDTAGLDALHSPDLEVITTDLENGGPWPLPGRRFAGVVVTNYLHRPLFPALLAALEPGGVLIYETFAEGNERFGKPSNPDFLLRPGELLEVARGRLRVVAYEDMEVSEPKPAMVQRLAARAP
jgi:SAM-dependent methyltransferase